MRRLILKSFQSPGDVVMLTAAVRDLHAAHGGKFQTDVRTSADAVWENNPHLTRLREGEGGVESLDMHYPLIHQSNQRPFHFIHGYHQYLEERLGLRIPVTKFHGDIRLSQEEKESPPPCAELGIPENFWIIVAGGKYDFTAKWWNPASFQEVVDALHGRIHFVQCGEEGHWHPRLQRVTDLVGKTSLREFIRLVYHAEGVLCPVTLAMHLAAAVETRPGRPKNRACVVVAGGREPPHWEAYPYHQLMHTVGALPCCAKGGCWKSRCQLVGDGDGKDRHNLCERTVQVSPELRIAQCMEMITPQDVIRRIEMYYQGGSLEYADDHPVAVPASNSSQAKLNPQQPRRSKGRAMDILIKFRHGLGDAVQLTVVLKHLRHYHSDWNVDVAALVGKHSACHGLCRKVYVLDRDGLNGSSYDRIYNLDWHECRTAYPNYPSTKAARCLLEEFRLKPVPELCSYTVRRGQRAERLARQYLEEICKTDPNQEGRYPAVLIHYQGNTSRDHKDLPDDLVEATCRVLLDIGLVPVILDWDRRSPLPDGVRIHNPDVDHPLWGGAGTGDAEVLAALTEASQLMIGVDSGPLHVAATTTTPTVAVWLGHHPAHYFDLSDHVLHLVPEGHEKRLEHPRSLDFFQKHYQHRVYRHLYVDLPAVVQSRLTGEDIECLVKKRRLQQLSATSYGERYYLEHKLAGLDLLAFGEWQKRYGRWFVESLGMKGKRVLDVGCACGAVMRGLGRAGAVVAGVDISEYLIHLGREKWPEMAKLLSVCDAVNLHLFQDASWDAIHAAQVAEHWKPELVPHILREFRRVVRRGGLLFCALDTEELVTRQGRDMEEEDPTHASIRPLAWWHERLAETGWQVCSPEFERPVRDHPQSPLKQYDWDWFVARKA